MAAKYECRHCPSKGFGIFFVVGIGLIELLIHCCVFFPLICRIELCNIRSNAGNIAIADFIYDKANAAACQAICSPMKLAMK